MCSNRSTHRTEMNERNFFESKCESNCQMHTVASSISVMSAKNCRGRRHHLLYIYACQRCIKRNMKKRTTQKRETHTMKPICFYSLTLFGLFKCVQSLGFVSEFNFILHLINDFIIWSIVFSFPFAEINNSI